MSVSSRSGQAKQLAHIDYIMRDGVGKEGRDPENFGNLSADEIREFKDSDIQFRMILSPNATYPPVDLEDYTKQFMEELEIRTGFQLHYMAVPHYNTDNPHVHIVFTDKDVEGTQVRFTRQQMSHDMRDAARDVLTAMTGERTPLQKSIESLDQSQMYVTDIDRKIDRCTREDGTIKTKYILQSDQYRIQKRLDFLEAIGAATRTEQGVTINNGVQAKLQEHKRFGIAQKEGAKFGTPLPENFVGLVIKEGTLDELKMNKYQIIEGVDGQRHYQETRVPFSTQGKAVEVKDGKVHHISRAHLLTKEGGASLYTRHTHHRRGHERSAAGFER